MRSAEAEGETVPPGDLTFSPLASSQGRTVAGRVSVARHQDLTHHALVTHVGVRQVPLAAQGGGNELVSTPRPSSSRSEVGFLKGSRERWESVRMERVLSYLKIGAQGKDSINTR